MAACCFLALLTAAMVPTPAHKRLTTSPRIAAVAMDSAEIDFSPALESGDPWQGMRVSRQELKVLVDEACATKPMTPIIPQFLPRRAFLWRGTLLWRIVPADILANMAVTTLIVAILQRPQAPQMPLFLAGVDRVWTITSGLVAFTLSFFLSQAYIFWRSVYHATRRVQRDLNALGLLSATAAERTRDGTYTADAEEMLGGLARLVRLFHCLLYSRVTAKFSPLGTPQGLRELLKRGALTEAEMEQLLSSGLDSGHTVVLEWIITLFNSALSDGRLCGSPTGGGTIPTVSRSSPGTPAIHHHTAYTALPRTAPAAPSSLSHMRLALAAGQRAERGGEPPTRIVRTAASRAGGARAISVRAAGAGDDGRASGTNALCADALGRWHRRRARHGPHHPLLLIHPRAG